jgi:hypothetical protein
VPVRRLADGRVMTRTWTMKTEMMMMLRTTKVMTKMQVMRPEMMLRRKRWRSCEQAVIMVRRTRWRNCEQSVVKIIIYCEAGDGVVMEDIL